MCVFVAGILTPTDEFQYWADLAASAKGEDRDRARYFCDTFQRQIAPQFASLASLSMADVTELVEETHDVLDEIWKQTDFDKSFPEARMKRLLEVIGTYTATSLYRASLLYRFDYNVGDVMDPNFLQTDLRLL